MSVVRVLVADPPRVVEVDVSDAEAEVVSRHVALVRALAEGNLSPEAFAGRAGELAAIREGLRLVDEPAAALALVEALRATDAPEIEGL